MVSSLLLNYDDTLRIPLPLQLSRDPPPPLPIRPSRIDTYLSILPLTFDGTVDWFPFSGGHGQSKSWELGLHNK
jgi:hypothetical protein